jgi:hypothetical protein
MAVIPVTKMPTMICTIEISPVMTQTLIVEIGIPVMASPVILEMVVDPTIKIPARTYTMIVEIMMIARTSTMIIEITMIVKIGVLIVPIVQIGIPLVVSPAILDIVVNPTTRIPAKIEAMIVEITMIVEIEIRIV